MAHSTNMDKTLKLRAYDEAAKSDAPQAKPAEDRSIALELAKKAAQLEEEKAKSLELLKTIVQLRESLKQEKTRAAELEAKSKELAMLEAKVKDLSVVLHKISSIAIAGKLEDDK